MASGVLPTGMVLTSSGMLQGTPLIPGSNTFILRVADEALKSDTQELLLVISVPEPALLAGLVILLGLRGATNDRLGRLHSTRNVV